MGQLFINSFCIILEQKLQSKLSLFSCSYLLFLRCLRVFSEKMALKLSEERMLDWMEDRIEHLQWRAPLRPSNKLERHAFVEKDTFRDESSTAT